MLEQSGIPIDNIVDVTSASVRDVFTIGRMNTIIVEKYNDDLPNDKFIQITNLLQSQLTFGFEAPATKFSEIFFSVKTKTATLPQKLTIYNWNKSDTPAILKGSKVGSLDELKALNGKFKITLGKVSVDITLDLSQASSLTDCASKIQTAIQGASGQGSNTNFTNSSTTFSSITGGFIVKGGDAGEGQEIAYLSAPDDGTDIHSSLGLTLSEGASILQGLAGVGSFKEVLAEINLKNGDYFVITPNFEFEEREVETNLKDFGTFTKNSKDKYMGVYAYTNPLIETPNSKVLDKYFAYDGLYIDNKKTDYQNAYVCGLISSIDFTKPSGNFNIAFNDAGIFSEVAIKDEIKYQAMIANRANAPVSISQRGDYDTTYLDGTIMGELTNSANVYVANSFLVDNMKISLYNMLRSQPLISRDNMSKAIITSVLDEVFQKAVNARIIGVGSELSQTDKNFITTTFQGLDDSIDTIIQKVQDNGYYFAIQSFDIVEEKLVCNIIDVYYANRPINKIVIRNFILGA